MFKILISILLYGCMVIIVIHTDVSWLHCVRLYQRVEKTTGFALVVPLLEQKGAALIHHKELSL